MRVRYLSVLLFALCYANASAQISVNGTAAATETFTIGNSATASLPANWKMSGLGLGATANWADAANVTTTTHQASSGSPADGGRYNWGDGTTERAVGFMTNATYTSPNSIMAHYRNTSSVAFTSLNIYFEIEQYRRNTSNFSLAFYSSTDGVNWTAQTGGDVPAGTFATGSSQYDFSDPAAYIRNFTITGLNIPANGDFYLRWVFTTAGNTNSMGMGLDDVSVSAVFPNPNLPISCPYDFIFVLDESGSITGSGGSTNIAATLRTAAIDLITALNGTGTRVAVVEFGTTGNRANVGGSTAYQEVNSAYITNFTSYMGPDANSTFNANNYDPEDAGINIQYTNWEAAFNVVNTINTTDGTADLVIFLTDGNPTAYTNAQGGTTTTGTSDPNVVAQALLEASNAANIVKGQGSHIFVVAIPNPSVLETNVHQISGTDRYPDIDTNFVSGDYTLSSSETLRDDLQRIAQNVCKVDLGIFKASSQSACSGDTVTFTLLVVNNGLDNDTNVVVLDTIPTGYTYVSDNGGATTTLTGNILTWNIPTLAGGGVTTSLQIRAIMNPAGTRVNRAHVSGTQEDTDLTNNSSSFTVNLSQNCDDGDPCTNDFCVEGVCAHSPTVCNDNDECTNDRCGDEGCEYLPRIDSLVIVCPDDIIVNSDAGQCQAVVNYDVPVGTSACQELCLDAWVRGGGGAGLDFARGVALDAFGNVYTTGGITNSATFGTTTLTGTGGLDIFIVKYSPGGTVKWAKKAGGTGDGTSQGTSGDYADGIATDANGNVYIAGWFDGTINFDALTLTSNGANDIFVAKYDSNGNALWAIKGGGSGLDRGYSVEVSGGFLYVTGYFEGDANIAGLPFTAVGNTDIFLAKFQLDGTPVWIKQYGGIGKDSGYDLFVANNKIYVTGIFNNSITFGSLPSITAQSGWDVFLLQTDAAGTPEWVRRGGGTNDDQAFGVIADTAGNVYMTGTANTAATFGVTPLSVLAGGDIFLAKYDNAGTLLWVKSLGSSGFDMGLDLEFSTTGKILLSAIYSGNITIGSTILPHRGNGDILVAKYDENGNLLTTRDAGGTGSDQPFRLVSRGGLFYVAGRFSNSVSFEGDPLQSTAAEDVFVWKLCETELTTERITGLGPGAAFPEGVTTETYVFYSDEGFSDTCSFTVTVVGDACDDQNACTTDNCNDQGVCVNTGLVCNDNNACTTDGCDINGQCQFTPNPVIASILPATVAICPEQVTQLTASGSGGSGGYTFAWSTGEGTAQITVGPATATTYTVTVTDTRGCAGTASRTVTLLPAATAAISPQTASVCSGSSTILTASGGVAYVWNTGATTTAITVSPTTNTTYTVTVTSADGCHAVASRAVTVNQTPPANINPATAVICQGQSTTLTATGGGTYAWNTGASTAAITVSPTATTTYTVTVTSAQSCTATATRTVTVNTLPNAAIAPATVAICPGSSATLTASGGSTYVWSTGASTAAITVSPTATTTYTVTVTDANGCSATASRSVTLQQSLVPTITPADVAICNGQSATLTASGGTSYVWSTGATTASVTVSPTTSTTYTVTVTDNQGCSGTASRLVTVNPLPTAVITPPAAAVCLGNSATLTASGGATYAWNTGASTAAITVSPTATTTYTVTVTDAQRCSATASRAVTVNTPPVAVITPPAPQVCSGATFTLTAGGGTTYVWNTGATTASITTSVQTATTFSVTVTDGNQCSSTASVSVQLVTCSDNNLCTDDACVNSACVFTPVVCNDGSACTTDDCNPQTGCTTATINCNDNNACTSDACLPASGCVNSTIICNDNSACTTDNCDQQTGCVFTNINCNDNNACTVDNCNAQTGCVYTTTNCNDQNSCTTDACDPLTGCTNVGIICNDNNACTRDTCFPGVGCRFIFLNCNDNNACTTDGCVSTIGCVHGVTNCNDQNACTTDGCDPIEGCTHTTVTCNDNSLCTRDSCTTGQGCVFIPVSCNDNDPCTIDDCAALTGCSNTPMPCVDTDPCTIDQCIEGVCAFVPVLCDDGDPCTNDACVGGICQFAAIVCNDTDLCTNDFCFGGNCVFEPVSCDDQNECTSDFCQNDVCDHTTIQGCCLSDAECDDNNLCTSNICNGFRCYFVAVCCNDDNACTYDFCLNGICVATDNHCDDGDLCTFNQCFDGICSYPPINCSDNDLCTTDTCVNNGICLHDPIDCNDANGCTTDFCDTTGACQHIAVVCDDGNFCTIDTCIQGTCLNTQVICNDLNACTDDFCVEGTCVYLGLDCDDQDVCTNDTCVSGTCTHPAINCNDGDLCTLDSCGVNGCFYTLVNCDDQDLCTVDFCLGNCQHVQQDCSDGNECTMDICVDGLCTYPPATCDDGIECTVDECMNGECISTPGGINVSIAKTDMSCGCLSQNELCLLDFAGLPAGTILGEQYAAQGIHISAVANSPGKNAAIIFNSHATGTPDPDLEVDYGNLMVIARDLIDTNPANGLVDKPNDNSTGGQITLLFDFPRTIESFDFVDEEEPGTFAFAYDAQDNLIAFIAVPAAGDASIQTIQFAASNVRKLVFSIDGSGAVTNIQFGDCCCDGTATASATGGTGPYNFTWSNGVTGSSIDNLCADQYCVTVTDLNGCFAISCTDIVQGGTTCDDGDSCTTDACSGTACIHTPIPGCEVEQPCVAEITDYTLVYETTLGDIAPLTEGMVIDRDEFCRFNIRANYCGTQISSVKFVLNGSLFRIEQDVPYALAGDNPTGNYHVWIPNAGNYTLTATPYSGPSATGIEGIGLTIHFSVVDNTPQDNENCLTPPAVDCNGDVNGTAFIDACGVCSWGNTGIPPNSTCECDAEVNITVETLPELCQGGTVLLKATTAGATSYVWSTGETTSQIFAAADAIYSVTTTDNLGCVASDTQTTPTLSALLASYVILAEQSVTMDRNKVFSGGVGVIAADGSVTLNSATQVTTPNTFVRAANIALNGGSSATTQFPVAVNLPLPAFEANIAVGGAAANVPANTTTTLGSAIYGVVTIDHNSTVTFTHAQIDIDSLITGNNVKVLFESSCVKIRVKTRVLLGSDVEFNADSTAEVKIYAGGSVNVGAGSRVIADIYTLGTLSTDDAESTDYTEMIGFYVADHVVAGAFTSWHWNPVCGCSGSGGPRDAKMSQTPELPAFVPEGKVQMRAYPNPFSEKLNLEFSIPADSKAKLDIFSSSGKKIATLFDGQVKATELRKVEYNPTTTAKGLVLYRLQTSEGVFYGKAVMVK